LNQAAGVASSYRDVLAGTAGTLSLFRILADDFQIRSEVDLDFVMFIRSAIATVAEVLSIVDLA
jgi:hypothetical protein